MHGSEFYQQGTGRGEEAAPFNGHANRGATAEADETVEPMEARAVGSEEEALDTEQDGTQYLRPTAHHRHAEVDAGGAGGAGAGCWGGGGGNQSHGYRTSGTGASGEEDVGAESSIFGG